MQSEQPTEGLTEPTPSPSLPLREADFEDAIDRIDGAACEAWLDEADAREAVHALAALSDEQRVALLGMISAERAAEALDLLHVSQAIEALEDMTPEAVASIFEQMPSDDRADLIKSLDEKDAEAILTALDDEVEENVRRLAAYEEDSAGALMVSEFLAIPESATIRDVLANLETNAERYRNFNVQYTYVVDEAGKLRGVLPIRRLLLARRASSVLDAMIADPISVLDTMPNEDLQAVFKDYPFIGLPVISADGTLIGVVEQSDVVLAAAEEADSLYRQSQGIVGGEELRSMPLLLRSRRRLAWLSVNIVLNILAASVIAFHQDTLEAVIALAVFLPIISDMSGCSGNQAVAVSMRELTLGVTRPKDIARVLLKECSVGILNGVALGILIGTVAYFWKGNIYLSVVVGTALSLNTLLAVCIGGAVPLILKGFKTDPALASGPILTTITDMCGFLIVLTMASAMMANLTGL